MPQTPTDLLTLLRTAHPASPRLIRHGVEGRIELSGRVFDNWVAKTANLLVDELDAVPGTVVGLDLPVHWKSLAIAFACWQVGAVVVLPDGADGSEGFGIDPDILMTAGDAEPLAPPRLLVCVALGSLAPRWDGPLPRGAVDFAAEVRSQGDVFLGDAPEDAARVLVHVGDSELTSTDLHGLVTASSFDGASDSAPVTASDSGGGSSPTFLLTENTSLLQALAAAMTAWGEDGALVIVEEGLEIAERTLVSERITARLGPSAPTR